MMSSVAISNTQWDKFSFSAQVPQCIIFTPRPINFASAFTWTENGGPVLPVKYNLARFVVQVDEPADFFAFVGVFMNNKRSARNNPRLSRVKAMG